MRKALPLFVAVLLFATAGTAVAQVRATGSIQGVVVGDDGTALPGVQVAVTGSKVMGEQVAYTGPDGGFRLNLLPPGSDYVITASLSGFATIVQTRIDVGVRRTTSLAISMSLSSVEETITVTGQSPLIDIKSTKRSTEVTDEVLNTLPEPRGVGGDLMNLSLDASLPSGGSMQSNGASFFGGTTASNAFQVDGATVSDPSGGSQFPFYSPDWFEVIEQTTTGAGADMGKGSGSIFNVITKSGGNTFHGEGNFYFQNNSFINDNTQDIVSVRTDFTPAEINHRYDFSFNVGGPVIRDKLWFFAGYQLFDENFRNPGVRFDQLENSDRFFGKLTWQKSADHRFIVSVMTDTFTLDGRPGDPDFFPEATAHEPSMNITPNITWDAVLSPDAFLEVKYSGFYGFFDLIPVSDTSASFDIGTGQMSDSYWGFYTFDRARTNIQVNLSYFAEDMAGDHSMRIGGEWERLLTDDHSRFGPQPNSPGEFGIYYPYFGEPYLLYQFSPDKNRNTSIVSVFTFYVQDDWTIGDRLTLNLGFRYDRWTVDYIDVTRGDLPTFNDPTWRLGAAYDVFGDGRTSAHVFYGRFYEEMHGTIFDGFDPNRSNFDGFFWDGADFVQFFSSDPLADFAIDPNLENQYSDQITVGVDRQVGEDWSISTRYIRKDDANTIGGVDTGSTFLPTTVTDINGQVINAWMASPRDEFITLLNNPNSQFIGDSFREYNGFQIKVIKRYSNDWTVQSSYILQKATGNITNTGTGVNGSTSSFRTPNRFVNTPGELSNSRRHVFKTNASYLLPDPIRLLIGARLDVASGATRTTQERFSRTDLGPLASGDRTLNIETLGSQRLDTNFNLDLRFEKKFQMPGAWGDVGLVFDIFNVSNEDTVRGIFTRVPLFGDPTSIVGPRTYRLGFRWLF